MSVLLDEETVILGTLDFDVPCATRRCDDAASWALSTVCCGLSTTKCDRCQEIWKTRVESKVGTPVRCGSCGHEAVLSWDFYRVVPL